MTGFSLRWYFEDGNGDDAVVEHNDKVSIERNEEFIRLVDIVHYGLTVRSMTSQEIIEVVKACREDWIAKEKLEARTKCDYDIDEVQTGWVFIHTNRHHY